MIGRMFWCLSYSVVAISLEPFFGDPLQATQGASGVSKGVAIGEAIAQNSSPKFKPKTYDQSLRL